MSRKLLRSVVAVASGWIVWFVGGIAMMAAIATVNYEDFKPGAQLSTGWWLVTLSVYVVYAVAGGFTAGAVARRNEIAHAAGFAVLSLVLSLLLVGVRGEAGYAPKWYVIATDVLMLPTMLLGGWLRMKQRMLLEKESEGLIGAMNAARHVIAITVSSAAFIAGIFLCVLLGVVVLTSISPRYFDGDGHAPSVLVVLLIPISIFLSLKLSRFAFRTIAGIGRSRADQVRGS